VFLKIKIPNSEFINPNSEVKLRRFFLIVLIGPNLLVWFFNRICDRLSHGFGVADSHDHLMDESTAYAKFSPNRCLAGEISHQVVFYLYRSHDGHGIANANIFVKSFF
jgi:hypothetical protein